MNVSSRPMGSGWQERRLAEFEASDHIPAGGRPMARERQGIKFSRIRHAGNDDCLARGEHIRMKPGRLVGHERIARQVRIEELRDVALMQEIVRLVEKNPVRHARKTPQFGQSRQESTDVVQLLRVRHVGQVENDVHVRIAERDTKFPWRRPFGRSSKDHRRPEELQGRRSRLPDRPRRCRIAGE